MTREHLLEIIKSEIDLSSPSLAADNIAELIEEICLSQRIACSEKSASFLLNKGIPITKGELTNTSRDGYSCDTNDLFLHIIDAQGKFLK